MWTTKLWPERYNTSRVKKVVCICRQVFNLLIKKKECLLHVCLRTFQSPSFLSQVNARPRLTLDLPDFLSPSLFACFASLINRFFFSKGPATQVISMNLNGHLNDLSSEADYFQKCNPILFAQWWTSVKARFIQNQSRRWWCHCIVANTLFNQHLSRNNKAKTTTTTKHSLLPVCKIILFTGIYVR